MAEVGTAVGVALLNELIGVTASHLKLRYSGARLTVEEVAARLQLVVTQVRIQLIDAGGRPQSSAATSGTWMEELHKIAEDAEDTLDDFVTGVLKGKVRTKNRLRPRGLISSLLMRWRLMRVWNRFVRLAAEKDMLKSITGGADDRDRGRNTPPRGKKEKTSSLPKKQMLGRDEEKAKILRWLLPELSHKSEGISHDQPAGAGAGDEAANYSVLLVVGMAGVGKTTLAQDMFHDEEVKRSFELRAWADVSDNFDVDWVTQQILESTGEAPEAANLRSLDAIQRKLQQLLERGPERFLLVLDDVWDVDWENLKKPLQYCRKGSRVLVTTQNQGIAAKMNVQQRVVLLTGLPFDTYWPLFKKHAFGGDNSHAPLPRLEEIAKKIARKMEGSPLAAKTLGSQLRVAPDEDRWETILNSDLWDVRQGPYDILRSLLVSYRYMLPRDQNQIKQCFVYCAIFPKGQLLQGTTLVQLWMAQGFVGTEEIGREYLQELVRLFFFESLEGDTYKMHSLMHDLSRFVHRNHCLWAENVGVSLESGVAQAEVRHLSCFFNDPPRCHQLMSSRRFNRLRTLMQVYPPTTQEVTAQHSLPHPDGGSVPLQRLGGWRRLRVLTLLLCSIPDLPESICNLTHLRYLNLSFTLVNKLPKALTRIFNLQTLVLLKNPNLKQLPRDMNMLTNLRHLEADAELVSAIAGIGKLRCLQELEGFKVGTDNGRRSIAELRDMANLRVLSLCHLENVESRASAGKAMLEDKGHLHSLKLEWSGSASVDGSMNLRSDGDVLEGLRPPPNLKELVVVGYCGTRSPSWIETGDHLQSLRELHLHKCCGWEALPPLGLLTSLISLKLESMPGTRRMRHGDSNIPKAFPSLESLDINGMPEWVEWQGVEQFQWFPRLRVLRMSDCPMLRLPLSPADFGSLESVTIEKCPSLSVRGGHPLASSLKHIAFTDCIYDASLIDSPLAQLRKTTALQTLHLQDDSARVFLKDGELQLEGCRGLGDSSLREWLSLESVTSISKLRISSCPCITSISVEALCRLTSLRELEISSCRGLKSVSIPVLPSLEKLTVEECPELMSMTSGEVSPSGSTSGAIGQHHTCLRSLTQLRISGCPTIRSFGKEVLGSMSTLKNLEITACAELASLALPVLTSLEDLKITDCPKLAIQDVSREGNESALLPLGCLFVDSAPLLTGCLLLSHPSSLRHLWITKCPQLASFTTEMETSLERLTSLEALSFAYCEDLQSLPSSLHSLPSLSELRVWNCKNVETLPDEGLPPSLSSLDIRGCPGVARRYRTEGDPISHRIAHVRIIKIEEQPL